MSEKQSKDVSVTVRLDAELHGEVGKIAAHTGVKSADLHRVALNRLVEHVKETGHLPIPAMPIQGEGDAA